MSITPADPAIYQDYLGDAEITAYFSYETELLAMQRVETALAKVQAPLNIIPAAAAHEIEQRIPNLQHLPKGSIWPRCWPSALACRSLAMPCARAPTMSAMSIR